jgi:hypothetical protein
MENNSQEYHLTENHDDIIVDFDRFIDGYSFIIKYHDILLYEYSTKDNKSVNHLLEIVKNYSFSKRYYYFKGLCFCVTEFMKKVMCRENEINKLTNDDFPFFCSAVYVYLGYLLRSLNESTPIISAPTDKYDDNEKLRMNIHNLSHLYPSFETDFDLLIKNDFIKPEKDGSLKLKERIPKQFLAEYFHSIKPDDKKMTWKLIEQIFNEEYLANSLSRNGNQFKNKTKAFIKWQEIRRSYIRS